MEVLTDLEAGLEAGGFGLLRPVEQVGMELLEHAGEPIFVMATRTRLGSHQLRQQLAERRDLSLGQRGGGRPIDLDRERQEPIAERRPPGRQADPRGAAIVQVRGAGH